MNSMRTINRETLLTELSYIVRDGAIMDLLKKFLYLPIQDESGRDLTASVGCSIPPSVLFLTDVLLNFSIADFYNVFERTFPGLDYCRCLH